jgi:TRAP-type C4-dicarboxylate transport system permease small subunit
MGDAGHLAVGMARTTLPARLRRAWRLIALSALAVFLAMRLRNFFVPVHDDIAVAHVALAIDRLAYWTALLVGVSGWLLARWADKGGSLAPVWTCATALATSGAAGVCLLFLMADGWRWPVVLPVLAAAAAIAVLGCAFANLRALARQARAAARAEAAGEARSSS